ncbi:MAG TPA: WbqC family protein [Paucimonas sp.]|nr:WbqC family protein [Paucimonas sp.]
MNKRIAIVQSNYIPWKGYFDLIAAVDEFILYDDAQFTVRDWRNRNKIKTPKGSEWMTIPVGADRNRRIRDVTVPASGWQRKHWKTLEANYRHAPFFEEIAIILWPLYLRDYANLSVLNRDFIEAVCRYLGITTEITNSWDYNLTGGKTERLVGLCRQSGATEYISGPSAKDYIEEEQFLNQEISLTWFDYVGYPKYPQLWGEFTHEVSIVDLLFNCGKASPNYMKFVRPKI